MRRRFRGGDAPHHFGGGALVVVQVALSLVLAVTAALFVRTFEQLVSRPHGFDRDRVLVVTVNAAQSRVDASGRLALYQRLVVIGRSVRFTTTPAGPRTIVGVVGDAVLASPAERSIPATYEPLAQWASGDGSPREIGPHRYFLAMPFEQQWFAAILQRSGGTANHPRRHGR